MKNRQALFGFTLIELLVTLVIVGVLIGVAVPSYFNSVKKTNRSDAKISLMNISQLLQKCYTVYGKFNDATNCDIYKKLTTTTYPSDGKYYTIAISNNAGDDPKTTFILTATAVKSPQTKDTTNGCDKLTLNHVGKKGTVSGGMNDAAEDACWKK